jgi:hypothetical protein
MKGPIVFLASLLATALLGLFLVRPLYRAVPDGEPSDAPPAEAALLGAVEGLRLAPIPDLGSAGERASGGDGIEVPWDRLPEILRSLSGPRAPAPRLVRVRALADPSVCSVEVRW